MSGQHGGDKEDGRDVTFVERAESAGPLRERGLRIYLLGSTQASGAVPFEFGWRFPDELLRRINA